jgi:hypothetical protein
VREGTTTYAKPSTLEAGKWDHEGRDHVSSKRRIESEEVGAGEILNSGRAALSPGVVDLIMSSEHRGVKRNLKTFPMSGDSPKGSRK